MGGYRYMLYSAIASKILEYLYLCLLGKVWSLESGETGVWSMGVYRAFFAQRLLWGWGARVFVLVFLLEYY